MNNNSLLKTFSATPVFGKQLSRTFNATPLSHTKKRKKSRAAKKMQALFRGYMSRKKQKKQKKLKKELTKLNISSMPVALDRRQRSRRKPSRYGFDFFSKKI